MTGTVPVSPALRHRLTVGSIAKGQPIHAMLEGEVADVLYSSPPWDDAHVKMYARSFDWTSFFEALTNIVVEHVNGWVFIESGIAMADNAAAMLSRACVDVTMHSTVYGPAKSRLPSRLLVGNTQRAVRGQWHIPLDAAAGGSRQPRGCVGSVAERGQLLLDPVCTNVYGAQTAKALGMVFYGNDHSARRADAIRRVLEK